VEALISPNVVLQGSRNLTAKLSERDTAGTNHGGSLARGRSFVTG
jgi:hypothetical protein